jgi:hypothetical protein
VCNVLWCCAKVPAVWVLDLDLLFNSAKAVPEELTHATIQGVAQITHSAAPATRASPTGIRAALKISPGVMSLRLALCATAK